MNTTYAFSAVFLVPLHGCNVLTDFFHQIINGAPISSVNPATLRNPECLSAYEEIGRRLRAEVAQA